MILLLEELVAVLVAEAGEYRRLLPLVEEEQRLVACADAAGLAELAARREALLSRLVRLERDRRAAVVRVASALDVDAKDLTLSRLAELVPAAARTLLPVRAELRQVLEQLLTRMSRNRFVVERTLECLRGLFAALGPAPAYAQSGRSARAVHELQLLDRRA